MKKYQKTFLANKYLVGALAFRKSGGANAPAQSKVDTCD